MFVVDGISTNAEVWHQIFLRRLRSHGTPDGRIVVEISTALEKLLRRGEEIEWEQVQDVQAALEELTSARWTYTIPGEAETKLVIGPVWNLIDMTMTADDDWTLDDETTWCVHSVTLQVGRWWHESKEIKNDPRRQIPLF
jgi:hypothetical protein